METNSLDVLQSRIFHRFSDEYIFRKSLMHRSNYAASAQSGGHNQRLEFLGDRVLGLTIAHLLYEVFAQEEEGALARRYASLVNRATLAGIANHIGLGDYLELANENTTNGLRYLDSTLEDALEALIGALYLDGGLEAAHRFISHYWMPLLKELPEPPKDAKTELQEWAQSLGLSLPAYQILDRTGPAHAPLFRVQVTIGAMHQADAEGTTKKAAEQLAAFALLEKIRAG
ncbi:MAG: ribonuclease III [Rickettsiales bacterium]|jgi:ribonuclease III|nr:ribonuclease III [Rickettsiales bacterium]